MSIGNCVASSYTLYIDDIANYAKCGLYLISKLKHLDL